MSSESSTLFVKGIPEGITQVQFITTISGAAKDVTKVNLDEKKRYCHISFGSHESAEKGLKALKKTPINGTILEFDWSVARDKTKTSVPFDEASNKTLYVGNLSKSTDLDDVKTAFAEHGEIERAFFINDKTTKASKGIAFVEFKDRDSAEKAVSELHESDLGGQTITVEFAKAPRGQTKGGRKPQQNGGSSNSASSKKPGQKRKADDKHNDNDNGAEDNGGDSEDKPAKKQKVAKETPKKEATTPKKETAAKETPKKEAKKDAAATAAATPKKETAAKETPKKEASTPKKETAAKETPKKEAKKDAAATPKKETAAKETPKKEAAKKETAAKETPKKESTEKKAATPKKETAAATPSKAKGKK